MEAIRIWLNGKQDYHAGVRLYAIYGKDLALKRSFAETQVTDYKKKRLLEVLEQLITTEPAPSQPIPAKPIIRTPGLVKPLDPQKTDDPTEQPFP
jgi:hypothetical protein